MSAVDDAWKEYLEATPGSKNLDGQPFRVFADTQDAFRAGFAAATSVSGMILSDLQRIHRLETLVCMLARGILQHEYAKDLYRFGTEESCKALANEKDLNGALIAISAL